MGDALCGPSNALQNFQKHTSVDRTLQQDRLTSRQPSAQGFRSQSPRDGILDPEFAAFEANLGGPQLQDFHHPAQFGGPAQLPHAPHPAANWASDFQNLNISGPSAPQIQNPPNVQAQRGWHHEFMNQQQQQQQQQPTAAQHMHAQPMANRGFQSSFTPNYSMYNNNPMSMQQMPQAPRQEHAAPVEQFDESAFEAAFDQARANLEELQKPEVAADTELPLHEMSQADPGTVLPDVEDLRSDIRIGSDTIPQSEKEDPLTRTHDADALAQTAGQLLDSVRHEQNQKFQQSNFLALMRRIRDREVEVEGDEFRETAQSLHPGGPYYPGQPRPPDQASSDNTKGTPVVAQQTRLAEDGTAQLGTGSAEPGDSNALYEKYLHKQGPYDWRRAPTFCFRDSLHHELEKLMVAQSNRNNPTPPAPPPYRTKPPQASPIMTDPMSDIIYTDEPNPLAITIDARINVVGNNNTLALTSERTPIPKKDQTNPSTTANPASGASTYSYRKQDRETRTAKLASIILKTLQQADGLTDERGRKRTISVLLKCGIQVEGCNNEVLSDGVRGVSSRSLCVSSRKRASSEPPSAPAPKRTRSLL